MLTIGTNRGFTGADPDGDMPHPNPWTAEDVRPIRRKFGCSKVIQVKISWRISNVLLY